MNKIRLITLGAICAVSSGLMAQSTSTNNPSVEQRQSHSMTKSQDQQKKDPMLTNRQSDSSSKKHKDTALWQNKDKSSSQSMQRSSSMSSSQQGVAKVEAEQKNQILRSSDLVGAEVTDDNENPVGTISDLHLSQNGQIEAAHIDIGGVLGIGSTTYRVPFNDLQVNKQGEEVQVQIQQQTLQELANLSPELQDEMEGWETQTQQQVATTQTETEGFGQSMRNMGSKAEQTTRGAVGAVGTQMSETGRDLQSFGQGSQSQGNQFVNRIRSELDSNSPAQQDISSVQVQMQQDRLILQGQVKNEQSKQDIVEAAESIAEGREVVDNLQVERSGAVGAAF